MKVHHAELSDTARYIEQNRHLPLEHYEDGFRKQLQVIKRFKEIEPGSEFLEIGTGMGSFPILCKKEGISCRGLEISPQLAEYGKEFGSRYGIEADIEVGNVEETDLGEEQYDVIIALSVFEHVEHWQVALKSVYAALKPGGLLYFDSTNKFSPTSGEYSFPLYGWLPDSWRYRLRIWRQGPDVMKLGIDFNQFTHSRLRRYFKELGFSRVLDLFEIYDPDGLMNPRIWKKALLNMPKPLRRAALLFAPATKFICIK